MTKTIPASNTLFSQLLEKVGLNSKEAAEKFGISLSTLYRWKRGEIDSSTGYPLAVSKLKEMADNGNTTIEPNSKEPSFTYIDLFAGIGGFRKAFDSIGGECVFTSEWDKQCRITYGANFRTNHQIAGDIRAFTKDKESLRLIPSHDLLVAGFPCQPFSLAGVSKKNALGREHGFKCDTQGTLFFDLAQIIEFHKPSVVLLENVKNLVSHDGGKTFKVIKATLENELGYEISFRILDGKNWVPQHRERIFIVGIRKDIGIIPNLNDMLVPAAENAPRLNSILHKSTGNEDDELPYFDNGKVNPKYTLTSNLWEYLQSYKEKHAAKGNGFGFSLVDGNDIARTLSARYYKDGSEILIRQKGKNPRRLTPRECSRLMGFDGPNESNFKIEVSDTQAYRQFGNSVIVPCATAVAEFIKPYILAGMKKDKRQLTLDLDSKRAKRKKSA